MFEIEPSDLVLIAIPASFGFTVAIFSWALRRRIKPLIRAIILAWLGVPHFSRNQQSDEQRFVSLIHSKNPREAKLIEFSSATVRPILLALREEGCDIRMLIKHPESVLEYQRYRIMTNLSEIFSQEFRDHVGGFDVRCYIQHAGIRGRMIDDDVVNIGWIVPTIRKDSIGRPIEVEGRQNPLITAHASSPEGRMLREMFLRVWTTVWDDPTTEDARVVFARLQSGQLEG